MRPKQGKTISLYLSQARLAKLGPEPVLAIYALIDGEDGAAVAPESLPTPPKPRQAAAKPPRTTPRPRRGPAPLCPRCSRIGAPSCVECREKAGLKS